METDLSLLPPLINRLSKGPVLREEMGRLRQLEGKATGKMILGESLKAIGVKVDANKVNLVARHDQIPYPVTINGGAVSFDGKRLNVRNLNGKVGASSLSDLTGGISFEREPSIEVSSGRSFLSLEEIYSWFSFYESAQEALKNFKSV